MRNLVAQGLLHQISLNLAQALAKPGLKDVSSMYTTSIPCCTGCMQSRFDFSFLGFLGRNSFYYILSLSCTKKAAFLCILVCVLSELILVKLHVVKLVICQAIVGFKF